MLVLTRKYQEKIRIGDNIVITVLRTKGKAVRLGIEAPTDVPVIRGELSFEPVATLATGIASNGEPVGVAASGDVAQRAVARRSEGPSVWTADSPHLADRTGASRPTENIGLKRVPRNKVAEILPQLVSGNAPLRAMMDRR